jgi:hypothetical protein
LAAPPAPVPPWRGVVPVGFYRSYPLPQLTPGSAISRPLRRNSCARQARARGPPAVQSASSSRIASRSTRNRVRSSSAACSWSSRPARRCGSALLPPLARRPPAPLLLFPGGRYEHRLPPALPAPAARPTPPPSGKSGGPGAPNVPLAGQKSVGQSHSISRVAGQM